MSPAAPSASPLRFLTPGQLGICLVLFFLPWVEIQCPMPKEGMKMNLDGGPPKPPSGEVVWTGLVHQSGLQAATGGYSFSDSTLESMAKAEKGKDGPKAAPLLFLYPLAAVAGIVLGLVMPPGGTRKIFLIVCCVLVLASAGGQAAMGFPISKEIKDGPGGGLGGGLGGGAGMGPGPNQAMKNDLGDQFKTVYKIPFFLALLFAAGGLVTALVEPTRPAADTRKRSKYDFDEEDGGGEPKADGEK